MRGLEKNRREPAFDPLLAALRELCEFIEGESPDLEIPLNHDSFPQPRRLIQSGIRSAVRPPCGRLRSERHRCRVHRVLGTNERRPGCTNPYGSP